MSNTLVFFASAIAFLAALFLLSALLSAINDIKNGKEDRKTENKSTSADGEKNYTPEYSCALMIENAINSYRRDQQASDKNKSRREKYSLILATLTLIFAMAAVGAAIYSATLVIEQNDINRISLRAVQRAFVNLSSIETDEKMATAVTDRKKFLIIRPVIANDGNTPTRELRYVQGATGVAIRAFPTSGPKEINTGDYITSGGTDLNMILAFGPPNRYSHPDDPDKLFSNKGATQRFALGPHSKSRGGMIGFDESEMRQAMAVGWEYYIYGAIRYYDVFPGTGEHVTKFCYVFERDVTSDEFAVQSRTCEYWNCTDDECDVDKKAYSDRIAKAM